MIDRIVKRFAGATFLAASLLLSACAQTEKQKVVSHLPAAIPTAYMLFYDKNSVVAPQSDALLLQVAAALVSSNHVTAHINAYRGPEEAANQDTLRAQAVLAFLVDHGVDPAQAVANPMGVADAIGKNEDGSARRRVEILVSLIAPAQ